MYVSTRNWFDSVQNMEYWRNLVNAALNLCISLAMESRDIQTVKLARAVDYYNCGPEFKSRCQQSYLWLAKSCYSLGSLVSLISFQFLTSKFFHFMSFILFTRK